MAKHYHSIKGIEEAHRILDRAPMRATRIINKSLYAAAQVVIPDLKSAAPFPAAKELVAHRIKKTPNGRALIVGFFGAMEGEKKFDWFKAYWANYGTLTRRDPNHSFDYPIKRLRQKRRNEVGQPAQNFFENALRGKESEVISTFEKTIEKNLDELYR
jgi:hypothetical protein